jgi:hypothetical protein
MLGPDVSDRLLWERATMHPNRIASQDSIADSLTTLCCNPTIRRKIQHSIRGSRMKKHEHLSASVLVVVTLVAGCGGSSKSSSSGTRTVGSVIASTSPSMAKGSPLTRQQLIAQADAICYQVNVKRSSTVIRSKQDIAQKLPALAATELKAATELSKLVPPASMVAEWKTIVDGSRTIAEDTDKLAGYAYTNPHLMLGQATMSKLSKTEEGIAALAKRNNFKDCAKT